MIETARLTLRPWVEGDREPFARIVADPQVTDWLGGPGRMQDPAYFDAMMAFWRERGHGQLALVRREGAAVIGRVGLRRQPPEWRHPMVGEVEVGWMLARDAWGFGYATEAAAAMLAWGFKAMDLPEVYSWTATANLRSQAVMRRLGMTRRPDRDFEHPDLAEGDPLRRHVVYGIVRPAT